MARRGLMMKEIAGTAFLAAAIVCACSSEDRPPAYTGTYFSGNTGNYGGSDGDGGSSGSSGSSGTSSGGDAGNLCEDRAQLCKTIPKPGVAPGPINGGGLPSGVYVLVGVANVSGNPPPCRTIYVEGGFMRVVDSDDLGDGGLSTAKITGSEVKDQGSGVLDLIIQCPTPARAPITYGFDGQRLTLQLPVGLGARTEVLQKQ